jgi:2-octaprenyl-6-methoxyphenol hydroxylase
VPPSHHSEVMIAGGGLAGLSLAIALRQALPHAAVTLADPQLERGGSDPRASVIAAAPRRMMEALGVWQTIAEDAQPILDMAVTDSHVEDAMRPVFLTFAGEIEPGEPFAHMVENGHLNAALAAAAARVGVTLIARPVADVIAGPRQTEAHFADGTGVAAKLVVAADGARSRLRERAGIAVHGWSYGQSAIVTTVAHERDHNGRAEEHFLPGGPFAILPLRGRRSSIVWTERDEEAKRIIALADDDFHAELERNPIRRCQNRGLTHLPGQAWGMS